VWIPAMIPDLRKVLVVNIAGSRPALVANSLRMKADLEAEISLMGLWRENRSGQLRTPQRRLQVHFFQASKVQTGQQSSLELLWRNTCLLSL